MIKIDLKEAAEILVEKVTEEIRKEVELCEKLVNHEIKDERDCYESLIATIWEMVFDENAECILTDEGAYLGYTTDAREPLGK